MRSCQVEAEVLEARAEALAGAGMEASIAPFDVTDEAAVVAAGAAVFLASNSGAYVTGQTITVDGGMVAMA